ncbi:MAG: DUF58 domain-containing protein [Elusimicrobia bacterium]|nr:DUF58 domain-containing protein [Elusimicrobiota bacterium]MBP8004379.1 DUF58 domain-containing protein [Elusimicrobiota bacterium]
MNTADVLKKVRSLEITARRLVNETFGGQYSSTFKGRGMEFAEVREYLPGDDIRSIDWNVTARAGHPFVKKYVEERELTVLFLVDVSGSQKFGTREQWKSERAAEMTAVLAFSALANNDKTGLILFSDRVEKYIPPRKTRGHTLRLIRDVLAHDPQRPGTSLGAALDFLNRVQRRRAVVFLLSDFIDAGFERSLRIAQRKHDLVAVPIRDPWERNPPKGLRLLVEDNETGNSAVLEPGFSTTGWDDSALERLLKSAQVDAVFTRTDLPYTPAFLRFFRARARRNH